MALTTRQKHLVDSTAARLREARERINADPEGAHIEADKQLRTLFDAIGTPEFTQLGDVYAQIVEAGWYS
jgi:hypothetical protein